MTGRSLVLATVSRSENKEASASGSLKHQTVYSQHKSVYCTAKNSLWLIFTCEVNFGTIWGNSSMLNSYYVSPFSNPLVLPGHCLATRKMERNPRATRRRSSGPSGPPLTSLSTRSYKRRRRWNARLIRLRLRSRGRSCRDIASMKVLPRTVSLAIRKLLKPKLPLTTTKVITPKGSQRLKRLI